MVHTLVYLYKISNLQKPVTEPDFPDVTYKAQHRRGDHLLITNASARKHLNYLCHTRLKKIKKQDVIHVDLQMSRTREMLQKVFIEKKFDKDGKEILTFAQDMCCEMLHF